MARRFGCKWVLALLSLAMGGAGWAAGGTYEEADPFNEMRRFERFEHLGGDLTQEQDVEFIFRFSDRVEARAENAQRFANRLRFRGYPKAEAQPCAREEACWLVIAPKRMRLDLKKNIALSKELDQLAADDYGRYDGWDCALFKREDERFIDSMVAESNKVPSLGTWLMSLDQVLALQCAKMRQSLTSQGDAADATGQRAHAIEARSVIDLVCTCAPEGVKSLRQTLPPMELAASISEAEVTQSYFMPKVMQPCTGKMVRQLYLEECSTLAANNKLNAETYCGCMQRLLDETSAADLMQLGLIAADYLPKAAQAQKHGIQPPDAPPLYTKFMASEAACRH